MTIDEMVASGLLRVVPIAAMRPTPDAENPNRMDAAQYAALRAGIRLKGFHQPPLLRPRPAGDPEGYSFDVVDGEHRRRAALDEGLTELPALVRDLSDDEVRAIRLGLNRSRGDLVLSIAREQVMDLVIEGWSADELAVTGFTPEELATLTAPPETAPALATGDFDDAPAPAPKPFVLEVAFADKHTYQLVRRRLLKAAGKTKDLARGLLAVLGEEVV